jgi:hypothetical protein
VNPKEEEKDVEILHSIIQDTKCEISVHASIGVSMPQTFKIIVYIKKKKVIVCVDLGSTYNFIDKRLVECPNYFFIPSGKFLSIGL